MGIFAPNWEGGDVGKLEGYSKEDQMIIGEHLITFDRLIILRVFVFLLSSYGAYENLIKKRLSRFGLDRIIYTIACSLDEKVKIRFKNSVVIIRLGFVLLLFAIGSVYGSFTIK